MNLFHFLMESYPIQDQTRPLNPTDPAGSKETIESTLSTHLGEKGKKSTAAGNSSPPAPVPIPFRPSPFYSNCLHFIPFPPSPFHTWSPPIVSIPLHSSPHSIPPWSPFHSSVSNLKGRRMAELDV